MYINKINCSASNIGFKSQNYGINDVGETVIKLNFPYDYTNLNKKYEIQIFKVEKTERYNYKVDPKPILTIPLNPNGAIADLQKDTELDKEEGFLYQVVEIDKNSNEKRIADTGVKMRQDGNELRFRFNQDPAARNDLPFTVLNNDGSVKLDSNGKPIIKTFGYESDNDYKNDSIDNYKYTLITRNGTTPRVQGLGYLAMPDTFMPGMRHKRFDEEGTGELVYDAEYQRKMEGMVKTISNMYGGNLAGLEAAIPELKKIGVRKLFTTPIANGDNRTSHGYYNKNNMQIQQNMGTSEDYDSLMVEEYKNGINHVFDATLTSEGIEGIHVAYALRWGTKAQTYRWFRMNGLKEAGIGFGVVPNEAKNLRHRVINAPYNYELQSDGTYKKVVNKNYKANQETLLQIYDASQVTDEQLSRLDRPIDMYRELNAGRNLDITTYDDTTISYVFEINPNEYNKNINNINDLIKKEGKKIELNSPDGTIMASNLSNFHINRMSNGYVAWDDNPDMVKFNYGISAFDEKELQGIVDRAEKQHEQELRKIAAYEAKDLTIQSLKYWADKTNTAHSIYTIQTLKNIKSVNEINQLIKEGKLPELPSGFEITPAAMSNILNGEYKLAPKGILSKDDVTVRALMSLPLDSLEFGFNTVGVLSTSYFSNRANKEDYIGVSRFDLMKQNNPHLIDTYAKVYNKVNALYTNELKDFAHNVIQKVNESSNEPLLKSSGEYTEYGEYVIEQLSKNIEKYALLKSLAGDKLKYKILPNGILTYNYDDIRNATTLKALGINASNPTEEAEKLLNIMQKGIRKLNKEDVEIVAKSVSKVIKGTDVYTYRLDEAFRDRAGAGLDYRLDAFKDLVDMDSVRNREADFDDTWTGFIQFAKKCVQGIKSINPHAYIVAEMTDIPDLMRDSLGATSTSCPYNGWGYVEGMKYNGEPDAMTKFYNETGITSEAAYSYFFTELLTSFSRDFETGTNQCDTHDDFRKKYMLLMNTRSADYMRNLYTFIGNHDKTRSIHGLAIDMTLFHSTLMHDFKDFSKNHDQRTDAIRVLSGAKDINSVPLELKLNVDNLDYFRTVSARAVAQSKLLMDSVYSDINGLASQEDINLLCEALADLANGNYMKSKTSEKLTRINIPEISSINNAVKEIAKLAKKYGVTISDREIQSIIQKANSLNYEDYLVRGDFDWANEIKINDKNIKIGDINKSYLSEILGNSDNAEQYSLYTVQIARMIKEASKDSSNAKAINNALKDFVNIYNREKINQNMDGYKMYEEFADARKKNSYAAQDFRVALEEAFNHAEFKSGRNIKNKDAIIAKVFNSVTEPAIKKHSMMLSFLSGLCGITTIFAGDEYGDTGYEDKSKNPNVRNRMASRRSEMERNTLMGRIMNRNKEITYDALKYKATVKPLQDGTPYMMDIMAEGKNREEILRRIAEINAIQGNVTKDSSIYKILEKEKNKLLLHRAKTAFLMQSTDGDMAISVFNAGGIDHRNKFNYFEKYGLKTKADVEKFMKKNNIESINPDNPYIPIQEKTEFDAILMGAGVAIPAGTLFINADTRDKTKYIVKNIGDKLGIVRQDGKKIIMDGLTAKNGVMVLRKIKNVAFRGSQGIYNNQYNFAVNPYEQKEIAIEGKELSLLAR